MGTKKITYQELYDLIECNYLPLHRDIGLNEPLDTQKAMDEMLKKLIKELAHREADLFKIGHTFSAKFI